MSIAWHREWEKRATAKRSLYLKNESALLLCCFPAFIILLASGKPRFPAISRASLGSLYNQGESGFPLFLSRKNKFNSKSSCFWRTYTSLQCQFCIYNETKPQKVLLPFIDSHTVWVCALYIHFNSTVQLPAHVILLDCYMYYFYVQYTVHKLLCFCRIHTSL